MFKKLIALITALFIISCSNISTEYIETSASELQFKFKNIDKEKEYFMILAQSLKEDEKFYYFYKILKDNNNGSVINVIKKIKVKKEFIKIIFNDEAGFGNRRVTNKNIIFL